MEKLTPQQVLTLVIRLFAIGLVLYSFQVAVGQLAAFNQVELEDIDILAMLFLGALAPIVVALFLWFFPLSIANRLVRPSPLLTETEASQDTDLYQLAFIVLGIYLLYGVISDTAYWWGIAVYMKDPDPFVEPLQLVPGQKAAIVVTAIEFVMSLFLIFGSKAISAFIQRVRHAS